MKGKKILGKSGGIPRGTLHGGGAASVKVGPIRTAFKDKVLSR